MVEKSHTPSNPGLMLVWVRAHVPLFHRLSPVLTREICTYLSPDSLWLADFYGNKLCVCDFEETTHQIRVSVELSASVPTCQSRWTIIDSTRLILCGGYANCKRHIRLYIPTTACVELCLHYH